MTTVKSVKSNGNSNSYSKSEGKAGMSIVGAGNIFVNE
jgi:hypothetical protein